MGPRFRGDDSGEACARKRAGTARVKKESPGLAAGATSTQLQRDSSCCALAAALGPHGALRGSADHVAHALVLELLDAFSLEGFGRVDVALRIDRDAVHAVELAGLASAAAKRCQFVHRLALDDADALVLTVGEIDELLLRILGEGDFPGRARGERVLGEEVLAHEGAVGVEDLDAIIDAIANVKQAVLRKRDAVHGIAVLLRDRVARLVGPQLAVVRLLAVGSPPTLDLAGVAVDHGEEPVAIAVGNITFIGLGIDVDLRDPSEVLRVVAARVLALMPGLRQELAVLGELQDLGILGAVAAEPDIALAVDEHTVHRFRPLVARARGAPGVDLIALRIEREHRRGRLAAVCGWRIELRALLVVVQRRSAAMDDPQVVLGVDRSTDGHAEQRLSRERLRPHRVDLEHRDLDHVLLRGRNPLQHEYPDADSNDAGDERRAGCEIPKMRMLGHFNLPDLSWLDARTNLRAGKERVRINPNSSRCFLNSIFRTLSFAGLFLLTIRGG